MQKVLLGLSSSTWGAERKASGLTDAMYSQLVGMRSANPWAEAETMPHKGDVPAPTSAARTVPSPAGGIGAVRGRKGARCEFTEQGPTPGPPPPCGMQKVLCRLRCETSEPHLPGRATPTRAFMLAPSVYTCPPCLCTISQISTTSSSNTPCVDG